MWKKIHIKRKFLLPILSMIGITSLIFVIPDSYKIQKSNLWYQDLTNGKFEVRDQFFIKSTEDNSTTDQVFINNNYELKLLLNVNQITDNENIILSYNESFLKKIQNLSLNYSSSDTSSIMPVAWFYFNNENDREIFVNTIKDWPEIHKFIIYKNENIAPQRSTFDIDYPDLYNPESPDGPYLNILHNNLRHFKNSVIKNAEIVGVNNSNTSNIGTNNSKIGILEFSKGYNDKRFYKYFPKGIEVKNNATINNIQTQTHAAMVSMIAGGEYGIDKNSKIYLSTFNSDNEWTKSIEQMVINDGVRLINHSYGTSYGENGEFYKQYSENSYYLDYIARKYGVINVYSAGNDGHKENHLIDNHKLSFDSIVVGALSDYASKNTLKTNNYAGYSSFNLETRYKDLPKPLVVAPGYFYQLYYKMKDVGAFTQYANGTSFSAPTLTALISLLLQKRSDINNSEFKIPIIKSILSASSISPKLSYTKYKGSGYEEKFGAGTVNFQSMLEAANNYSTVKVHPTQDRGTILTSNEIFLNTNQTIKVSSSWTFNAGLLKNAENKPKYSFTNNWWNSFQNFFNSRRRLEQELEKEKIDTQLKKWNETHKNEFQLKSAETFKNQDNKFFSDYDLYLEYKNPNGTWQTIKKVTVASSNDELIDYKVTKSGIYRYRIYKFSINSFWNSVDDLIAVTHMVKNDEN